MYWICIQGITGFVGTSSIASALGYSFAKNGWNCLCIDGYHDSIKSTTDLLYNLDGNTKGWFDNLCNEDTELSISKYSDKCYYLPFGTGNNHYDSQNTELFLSRLKTKISEYRNLDYIVVDAGIKNSPFASSLVKQSDMVISVMIAEGNCLSIFDEQDIRENEYLVLNKFMLKSTVMNEVELRIRASENAGNFLKTTIKYDEAVIQSFLHQMPVTRYMPISVASDDIEKLMFDIVFICTSTAETEHSQK